MKRNRVVITKAGTVIDLSKEDSLWRDLLDAKGEEAMRSDGALYLTVGLWILPNGETENN